MDATISDLCVCSVTTMDKVPTKLAGYGDDAIFFLKSIIIYLSV